MLRIVNIPAFVVVFFGQFKIISYLCTIKQIKGVKDMAFRKYQEEIYSAVINKTRDWMANNVSILTKNGITEVVYYRTKIAVVNHNTKSAKFDNGGYTNAATTARINAVKEACDYLGYKY